MSTTLNVGLLQAVRAQVLNDPGHYNQGSWATTRRRGLEPSELGPAFLEASCPTTACVAGWAVRLAGGKFIIPPFRRPGPFRSVRVFRCLLDGELGTIRDTARDQLGLLDVEADYLFHCARDSFEVVLYLDKLIRRGLQEEAQQAQEAAAEAESKVVAAAEEILQDHPAPPRALSQS